MGYNIHNIDADKFNVYFHFPTNRLIAVEKEESRKYVFQTDSELNGIFLTYDKSIRGFTLAGDIKESVLISELRNTAFKMLEFS